MITRAAAVVPRTLGAFAEALGARLEGGSPDRPVHAIADDSREVRPGTLFFARRGSAADGREFLEAALAQGAAGVVLEGSAAVPGPALRVADAARTLRLAADLVTGSPQDVLDLVGITGTKGKTTTAWLAQAALRAGGLRTACFGTIANDLGDGVRQPAKNTTPGVLELRRLLQRAREKGAGAAVLEVSSHALEQGRTEGLPFHAGVFTNLGLDHLDYHEDVEAYFEAKSRLFRSLDRGATAVINRDDPRGAALVGLGRGCVLTYGEGPEADLRVHDVRLSAERMCFSLTVDGELQIPVRTRLVGRHNALNVAAAVGAARALGVEPTAAVRGIEGLAGVPGRLERVTPAGDLLAFVDYAHTAEALEAVLGFLTEVGAAPIVCVIGCGGDRDRTKRPRMAKIAAERADWTVLTSDNPRTESPRAILADMEAGVPRSRADAVETVPDRREAIRHAVLEAPPGATLLVAGKGHEDYQILGHEKVPFDDRAELRDALLERARRVGGGTEVRAAARPGEV